MRVHFFLSTLAVSASCLTAPLARAQSLPARVTRSPEPSASAAGASMAPQFSGDGRLLVFVSEARNLATNDDRSALLQVYSQNLSTRHLQLISVNDLGVGGGNGHAVSPSVSSNGTRIVFSSEADNLAGADGNRASDIFLRDLTTGTTTLLSVASTNAQSGHGASSAPQISGDGLRVVFESTADDLTPGDGNGAADVFVRDIELGSTRRVSAGIPSLFTGLAWFGSAASSEDGQDIAFVRHGTNDIGGAISHGEIFLHDMRSDSVIWISAGVAAYFDGENTPFRCLHPAVSSDGKSVVFLAARANAGRTGGHLFRYEREGGQLVQLATNAYYLEAPKLSRDGQSIAYEAAGGIRLWEKSAPQPTMVCGCGPSNVPMLACMNPSMDAGGHHIAFIGAGPELPPVYGVYVFDKNTGCSQAVSVSTNGIVRKAVGASHPILSQDGTMMAFESSANDLTAGDLNLAPDVFTAQTASPRGSIQLVSERAAELPSRSGAPAFHDARTFGWRSVSANGAIVAYGNGAPITSRAEAKAWQDIYSANLRLHTTESVSGPILGLAALPNYAAAPMLSADGRYVAYLSPDPAVSLSACKLTWKDQETGQRKSFASSTVLVLPYQGTPGRTILSPNGRYVAERSSDGSGLNLWDMFAANPAPEKIDAPGATSPEFSPDGRWLVYFKAMVPSGLYARDLQRGTTRLISYDQEFTATSVAALGVEDPHRYAAFSADSRFVFYQRTATHLLRHDLLGSNANIEVCVNCRNPSPNADGSKVAVQTSATSGRTDVFVIDLANGQSNLVTWNASGTAAGRGRSFNPNMSYDGRYVAFASQAGDLVSGDQNLVSDIFVRDLRLSTTILISQNQQGTGAGNAASFLPVLAANGRTLFFQSIASDLLPDDYARNRDLFVLQLGGPDSDGDGLEDDWEMAYFGTLARDGSGDYDSDGSLDRVEFAAGTDPANDASVLRVLTLNAVGVDGRRLLWSAAPGRRYQAQYREALEEEGWKDLGGVVTAAGTTATQFDNSELAVKRFYRVRWVGD